MNKEQLSIFSTSDLSFAAALCLFFPLESITRITPQKVIFNFSKKSKNLEIILKKYWRKELRVEPQAYFQSLRQLKNLIYNN